METQDSRRIERAMGFMAHHFAEQPSLADVAAHVGLSRYHFQRLFSRWAGISPTRFLQCLTLQQAKAHLEGDASLLDASLDAGLSGPGRLHDLFVTHEAVSPGDHKRRGAGLEIAYGLHATPFGPCLVGITDRGICALSFLDGPQRDAGAWAAGALETALDADPGSREADALARLNAAWPRAALRLAPDETRHVAERAFGAADQRSGRPLRLLLQGTNFQIQVWRALLNVPSGGLVTYGQLAGAIGKPGAARAVGQALNRNPISGLIPCHRVIRGLGLPGGYRWGETRKRMLLAWEAATATRPATPWHDTAADAPAALSAAPPERG